MVSLSLSILITLQTILLSLNYTLLLPISAKSFILPQPPFSPWMYSFQKTMLQREGLKKGQKQHLHLQILGKDQTHILIGVPSMSLMHPSLP